MKILFLLGNLNLTGGTERVTSIIANQLAVSGYDVLLTSISCGDKPFFPLHKKIKTFSLFDTNGRALYRAHKTIFRLRKLLKKEKVDVLVVVDTISTFFTLPAAIGLPVKHIAWEHFSFNNYLGKKSRWFARQLSARFSDSVVTLTERDKEYWLQGTQHKNQITAIPNPCPFPVQDNAYSKHSKIILAVGRLVNIKGYDLLLQAWLKVIKYAPDWQLKIVGEGEERASLSQFITDNNLADSVELVGNTDNVQKYYEQAAIFCLSSRFEGFPMVLLETLSFGLPVVSFDCDTGPAEILDGTGSILVKPYDTDQLADGLINLINNLELRIEISHKSKEKSKNYQIDNILGDWIDLLNR